MKVLRKTVYGALRAAMPLVDVFRRPPGPVRKILIVRRGAIGDVLLSTPLLRALRENFPAAHIAYLVGRWSREAVLNNPCIDEVMTFNDRVWLDWFSHMREKIKTIRDIRSRGFDTVITLDGEFWFNFLLAFSGAHTRIGFDAEGSGFALTHTVPYTISMMHSGVAHRAEMFLRLLHPLGVKDFTRGGMELHIGGKDRAEAIRFLESRGVRPGDAVVAIAPGGCSNPATAQPSKRWGPDGFAKVADTLIETLGARIVLMGKGEGDVEAATAVEGLMKGKPINSVDRFSLAEAAALIENSALFISNDTGLMHAASSTSTPIVAVFGPTNPSDCGPYVSGSKRAAVVRKKLECSNCYERKCPRAFQECMELVTAEDVVSAARALVMDKLQRARHVQYMP
jgi:lipopolysaccharide heptosyltransferase II